MRYTVLYIRDNTVVSEKDCVICGIVQDRIFTGLLIFRKVVKWCGLKAVTYAQLKHRMFSMPTGVENILIFVILV